MIYIHLIQKQISLGVSPLLVQYERETCNNCDKLSAGEKISEKTDAQMIIL